MEHRADHGCCQRRTLLYFAIPTAAPWALWLITVPPERRWRWTQQTWLLKGRSRGPPRPTVRETVHRSLSAATRPIKTLPFFFHENRTVNFHFFPPRNVNYGRIWPLAVCLDAPNKPVLLRVSAWKKRTLTDSSTDWARTSRAIVLLKNGCWVMSYILALNPSLSAKERLRQGHFRPRLHLLSCLPFPLMLILKTHYFFFSSYSSILLCGVLQEGLVLNI